ncbi:MAG: glycine cleavage system protein H [Ilumatobacter coccineus]|uniref:Glycine cleavage system H protein n=1 Tax=Ilumatobacter coccineus TaxID=467094 RepID=A0A2G6KI77_9ACTN|nr:MAG: glycine cleavage system protein H [Ilumatobacter coccineus]
MNVPQDLAYSQDHEWARSSEAGPVRVGITEYAQDALGDIVFVDLPEVGDTVEAGEMIGELESTKSVSELYAPISGKIVAVNDNLADAPETVNDDPYGEGWLVEIEPSDPSEMDGLLDAGAYLTLTEG